LEVRRAPPCSLCRAPYNARCGPPTLTTIQHGQTPSLLTWRKVQNVSFCEGLQTPAVTSLHTRTAAGVWKPPRDETAGRGTYEGVPRAQLWGFSSERATAELSSEGE
jgi:hypothetical protein